MLLLESLLLVLPILLLLVVILLLFTLSSRTGAAFSLLTDPFRLTHILLVTTLGELTLGELTFGEPTVVLSLATPSLVAIIDGLLSTSAITMESLLKMRLPFMELL